MNFHFFETATMLLTSVCIAIVLMDGKAAVFLVSFHASNHTLTAHFTVGPSQVGVPFASRIFSNTTLLGITVCAEGCSKPPQKVRRGFSVRFCEFVMASAILNPIIVPL